MTQICKKFNRIKYNKDKEHDGWLLLCGSWTSSLRICDARVQSMTKWKHPPRHGRRSVNPSIVFFFCSLSSAPYTLAAGVKSFSAHFISIFFSDNFANSHSQNCLNQSAFIAIASIVVLYVCEAGSGAERSFTSTSAIPGSIQIDSFERFASGIRSSRDLVAVARRRNGESGNSVWKNFILLPNEIFVYECTRGPFLCVCVCCDMRNEIRKCAKNAMEIRVVYWLLWAMWWHAMSPLLSRVFPLFIYIFIYYRCQLGYGIRRCRHTHTST